MNHNDSASNSRHVPGCSRRMCSAWAQAAP